MTFEELRDYVFQIFIENKVFYISKINGKLFYIKSQCAKRIIENLNNENIKKYFNLFSSNEEAWYCLRFKDAPNNHICPVCGKPAKFQVSSNEYGKTCSRKCGMVLTHANEVKEKIKQTCLDKYGVDNVAKSEEVKEKIKQTCLDKYGVEVAVQSKEIREKIEQTCLKRYGVKSPGQNEEVKKRIEETCLKKYGVKNAFANEDVKKKIEETNIAKYGAKSATQNLEIKKKILNTKNKKLLELENKLNAISENKLILEYGCSWSQVKEKLNIIPIKKGKYTLIKKEDISKIVDYYNSISNHGTSLDEKEVVAYVKSIYNGAVEENKRNIIPPNELDIFIPEKNVAIEYNGLYWHSTYNKLDKNYHLKKTIACEEKNIRLIHIFSDEWEYKKDIVKSIISSALGIYKQKIYARNCEVKKIFFQQYSDFLKENHIQGSINSELMLGLFYNNELVQVAGWGKSRFKNGEIELQRMATKKFTQVIGGFSKLIKHSKLNSFISFVDRRLFNGKGYKAAGFKLIGITEPSYFYSKDFKSRENRLKFQKHKLSKILDNFDENLTEEQNMLNNNFYRIYDCGTLKVAYNNGV